MKRNILALRGAGLIVVGAVVIAGFGAGSAAMAAAPIVRTGDTVHDPAGGIVGTIQSVGDATAVVWTGSRKITLGLTSFMMRARGLTIAMTRAQLEQAASAVQSRGDAEIRALLTPGTSIIGEEGSAIAVVDSVEAELVVLAVGDAKVKFPLSSFSRDQRGIRLGMTAAALAAAIEAQRPAKPATPATAPAADPATDPATDPAAGAAAGPGATPERAPAGAEAE